MRDEALALAALDRPDLDVADVGAGTGFTTAGIVARVAPEHVTMIDQSPHQLARARAKPALAAVRKEIGDAEALPLPTDAVDRYVSAGSIEYWPDPQRAIAEAYRVVRPGGVALIVGPLRRTHPIARRLSDAWMLFPSERRVRDVDAARRVHRPAPRRGRAAVVARGVGRLRRRDRRREAGGGAVAARACPRRRRARRRPSGSARRASHGSRSARSPARRSSRSPCGSRCATASGAGGAAIPQRPLGRQHHLQRVVLVGRGEDVVGLHDVVEREAVGAELLGLDPPVARELQQRRDRSSR